MDPSVLVARGTLPILNILWCNNEMCLCVPVWLSAQLRDRKRKCWVKELIKGAVISRDLSERSRLITGLVYSAFLLWLPVSLTQSHTQFFLYLSTLSNSRAHVHTPVGASRFQYLIRKLWDADWRSWGINPLTSRFIDNPLQLLSHSYHWRILFYFLKLKWTFEKAILSYLY